MPKMKLFTWNDGIGIGRWCSRFFSYVHGIGSYEKVRAVETERVRESPCRESELGLSLMPPSFPSSRHEQLVAAPTCIILWWSNTSAYFGFFLHSSQLFAFNHFPDYNFLLTCSWSSEWNWTDFWISKDTAVGSARCWHHKSPSTAEQNLSGTHYSIRKDFFS